jgi:hypothetical protein
MMRKYIENKLIEEFKDKEHFSREELFDFFRYFEPDLKEGTFGWRIYDLKQKNIIRSIKRGVYVISYKPGYEPLISPDLLGIAKQLSERFKEIKFCIWETMWLNEFAQHQMSRSVLIIEMEKGFEESFFYNLKDFIPRDIFLNPDEKEIDLYIAESNQPVVLKKLLTRSPVSKRTENNIEFYIPTLEKILVDLFTEEKLFHTVQGSELIHVYENAITGYSINFTKMFSYAKRRQREQDIKKFLSIHMSHVLKGILDD